MLLSLFVVLNTGLLWASDGAIADPATTKAGGPSPLVLSGQAEPINVWSHLRIWHETAGDAVDVRTLIGDPDRFTRPQTPRENLGVTDDTVWVRLPFLLAPTAPADWLFNLDVALMDEMSVYLVKDGRVVANQFTGKLVPVSQRPLPLRTMGVPLRLEHGAPYELLVRLRNSGAMLVPAHFVRPTPYYANEARIQLLQGVAAGLGIFLVAYSLMQWLGSRNAMYVYFAGSTAAATGFALAAHGLGAQHLWPGDPWLINNAGVICGFVTLAFSLLFAERALDMARQCARLSLVCRSLSAVCALALACFVADILSYGQAHWLLSLISGVPMAVALPPALRLARRRDTAAVYMVVGWLVFGAGTVTFALLVRGVIPFSSGAMYAAQLGSMVQMLAWLGVLSVHTKREQLAGREAEQQRQQAEVERAQMASLALTDPLTGLANRRGLEQHGERIVAQSSRRSMAALLMLDLDNFKPINDTYGHDVGDELLVGVAGRLRACVGDGNCVARLGGDEFVIVVSHLFRHDEAQALAERILKELTKAFYIRGQVCEVGVTVGYALSPENGSGLRTLLEAADAALYQGKNQGKSQVQRWVPGLVNPQAREALALA